MNFGNVLIYLATTLGVILVLGGWRTNERPAKWQKWTYMAMAACIVVATLDLLYLFLAHQFQYSYVYGYSSRDLPLGYLVSSLWAGQEGTFLLWAFFGALLGLFLLNRRDTLASRTLTFFVITQLFLLVLMIVKSPFATLEVVPPDGRGLNPLLQDPWMVIHPPIIFIGYAALAIPFAQAMAAMISRKFENFAAISFPWVAFSVASLGAGIFIGGFWAYKVLG
jgi:cytochrome c-type biogenesis protein CcmF